MAGLMSEWIDGQMYEKTFILNEFKALLYICQFESLLFLMIDRILN